MSRGRPSAGHGPKKPFPKPRPAPKFHRSQAVRRALSAGLRRWWAEMSPEERSARCRRRGLSRKGYVRQRLQYPTLWLAWFENGRRVGNNKRRKDHATDLPMLPVPVVGRSKPRVTKAELRAVRAAQAARADAGDDRDDFETVDERRDDGATRQSL